MNNSEHQACVLIVDDERTIADTFALILKRNSFRAWAAYSGESAITKCTMVRPDVLIIDVLMGAPGGIAVAMEIRRRYPSCRVILMSGSPETGDLLEDARRRGHEFEILAKPFRPAELLRKIREVLEDFVGASQSSIEAENQLTNSAA